MACAGRQWLSDGWLDSTRCRRSRASIAQPQPAVRTVFDVDLAHSLEQLRQLSSIRSANLSFALECYGTSAGLTGSGGSTSAGNGDWTHAKSVTQVVAP